MSAMVGMPGNWGILPERISIIAEDTVGPIFGKLTEFSPGKIWSSQYELGTSWAAHREVVTAGLAQYSVAAVLVSLSLNDTVQGFKETGVRNSRRVRPADLRFSLRPQCRHGESHGN